MTDARPIKTNKLFWGSSLSLLTTAFAFTVITTLIGPAKGEFVLTNAQAGFFASIFFLGFTISQVIFSPLCDTIGIRWIIRGAWVGHVAGAILLMMANGYTTLVAGSICAGLGAGLVEAGCNPLVAALYPDDKTTKLNLFHMWFPYGNLIAAIILTVVFTGMELPWRTLPLLILIPAVVYGVMMLFEKYPPTEGSAAGVSFSETLKACFTNPIMLLMMGLMVITASMELPPSGWVPAVLGAGGKVPGLLVFGFIFGIMGTLRLFAGPVVKRLSPTGILLVGSILATIGLFTFSYAGDSIFMAFLTAALWAVGIAYFWPTMLGYVSEKNPKSGALGLGIMGAMGMLASFIVQPWLGGVADDIGHTQFDQAETVQVMRDAVQQLPGVELPEGFAQADMDAAVATVQGTLDKVGADNVLPPRETANALRAIVGTGATAPAVTKASEVLGPADNYGGLISFRRLSFAGIILIVAFFFLWMKDRKEGGYKAEKLGAAGH